jgi:carboxylate-amine ligase
VQLDIQDAVTLAGSAHALVTTSLREQRSGIRCVDEAPEFLAASVWQAARHGLDGPLVRPLVGGRQRAADVVASLVEHITPALQETGDLERVTVGVERPTESGEPQPESRARPPGYGTPGGHRGDTACVRVPRQRTRGQ